MPQEPKKPRSRKPYRPPRLTRYGDLATLTQGGGGAKRDGGGGAPKTKTGTGG